LDPDELQSLFRSTVDFEAQLYRFANALRDLIQRPRLRMTCRELWNRGYVVAFLVSFNDNIKLAWH
jgi:hypothetical protein